MGKLRDRYAKALMELSEEKGTLEGDLELASGIREALAEPEIVEYLTNPSIPAAAKKLIFKNAFQGMEGSHFMGFLELMVDKNRESIIHPVLDEYIDRVNERLGRIEARIVSARVLSEDKIESITRILRKKTRRQIEVLTKTDPDIIGGFYVLVDGQIFDGTVRTEINTIRQRLKRGDYKW